MRLLLPFLLLPALGFAQTPLITEFPGGATPLASETVKTRFAGSAFSFKGANGVEIRVKFQDSHALVNTPTASDSGTWKVEGSAICIEFRKFPSGCNEIRSMGDVLYWKRASNGEVVSLNRE